MDNIEKRADVVLKGVTVNAGKEAPDGFVVLDMHFWSRLALYKLTDSDLKQVVCVRIRWPAQLHHVRDSPSSSLTLQASLCLRTRKRKRHL